MMSLLVSKLDTKILLRISIKEKCMYFQVSKINSKNHIGEKHFSKLILYPKFMVYSSLVWNKRSSLNLSQAIL